MLLSVNDIKKSFESLHTRVDVLKGISFNVNYGDRLAITGRNGTGKSTLLKIIAKEIVADSGTIEMDADIRFVYLAQSIADYTAPGLTVLEHISLGLLVNSVSGFRKLLKGERIRQIEAMFEDYDIPLSNRLNTFVGNLSGGERQIVATATLIALKPQLFLLDEFTSSLDPATTELILNNLVRYQKENRSAIVFVSHDKSLVNQFSKTELSLDFG